MSEPSPVLVYLHGMPGSHHEPFLFGPLPVDMFIPDRTRGPLNIGVLAGEIKSRFPVGPITLIGFSMGAFVAMHLAIELGDRIDQIQLIAPAAPITDEPMLTAMAGGPIFRLARRSPWLFRLVTRAQALVCAVAPRLIFRSLFASAQGEEHWLAQDAEFEQRWITMARHCLSSGAAGYCTEILGFVADWSAVPQKVIAPVTVWKGMLDGLTPPALVDSLIASLPNVVEVHVLPSAGHYSTLKAALPRILDVDS